MTDCPDTVVYFLGAGASASVAQSVVVTSNLLRFVLDDDSSVYDATALSEARTFVDFLTTGDGNRAVAGPRIDDVLSLVDLALARRSALGLEWPVERLRDVRRALLAVTFQCIETHVQGKSTRNDALTELVRSIVAAGDRAIVVTLNWDCLVEEAVFFLRKNRTLQSISYGLPCHDAYGKHIEPLPKATMILKPHGSISWNHCALCMGLFVGIPRSKTLSHVDTCPACGKKAVLQPVVVAPTLLDWPEPVFLEQLWLSAEEAIVSCDRLVFIGYSLPTQDVHVRLHIVRALARRAALGRRPLTVEVIAKGESRRATMTQEESRYRSLLGRHVDLCFREFPNGLSDWIARGPFRPEVVS